MAIRKIIKEDNYNNRYTMINYNSLRLYGILQEIKSCIYKGNLNKKEIFLLKGYGIQVNKINKDRFFLKKIQ